MPGFLTRLVQRALVPAGAPSRARPDAFEALYGPDAPAPAGEPDDAPELPRALQAPSAQPHARDLAPSHIESPPRPLEATPFRAERAPVPAGAAQTRIAPAMEAAHGTTQPGMHRPAPIELRPRPAALAAIPAPHDHAPQAIGSAMPGLLDGGPPLADASSAWPWQLPREAPPAAPARDTTRTSTTVPPIDRRPPDPGDASRQPPMLAPVLLGPAAARPATGRLPEPRARMAPPAPEVHVTIGRVELRTTAPSAPRPSPRAAAPRPALSLTDYLARRDTGGAR